MPSILRVYGPLDRPLVLADAVEYRSEPEMRPPRASTGLDQVQQTPPVLCLTTEQILSRLMSMILSFVVRRTNSRMTSNFLRTVAVVDMHKMTVAPTSPVPETA